MNRQHIAENINIFDFELCPEDMDNIESLNYNLRYFKFSGYVKYKQPVNTSRKMLLNRS